MLDEDKTAAKLRGYNCIIKFKDGEELLIKIPELNNENEVAGWFSDAEEFINNPTANEFFQMPNIALKSDTVKYIIAL